MRVPEQLTAARYSAASHQRPGASGGKHVEKRRRLTLPLIRRLSHGRNISAEVLLQAYPLHRQQGQIEVAHAGQQTK
jgi:hypothetical protein